MPNYANGKIYKIWSTQTEQIYIGSTCTALCSRLAKHRNNFKQYKVGKRGYMTSFEILKYGDAKIELIEDFKTDRREQLTAREGHYIRTLNCVNKRIENRTKKEYYEANKDEIKEHKKQYYEDNKDKIKEYKKQYYEDNKEKLKEKRRKYREQNKEKIKKKDKQYYEQNKEKYRVKIKCECGSVVIKNNLTRHKRSKKHIIFTNQLN